MFTGAQLLSMSYVSNTTFPKKKIIINIFEKKSLTKFTSLQNCLSTYCNFDVNESILYKIQNKQPTGTKHRRKRKGNEINQ